MIPSFSIFSYVPDSFALITSIFIAWIGISVASFSTRYLKGEPQYRMFFLYLGLLITSSILVVSADSFWIVLMSSCISHLMLVRLMLYHPRWQAARASGMLMAKTYCISLVLIASAFLLFYLTRGTTGIDVLVHQDGPSLFTFIALVLILIAAMMQMGLWPFHRGLVSALNAPTPVCALMHAGIAWGGGFLLIRFAPLYLNRPFLLGVLFSVGVSASLFGTMGQFVQSDVKRGLACSTIAQMGFVLTLCGLGLFPLAVIHLVWHGASKAYLFLASSGMAHKPPAAPSSPSFLAFISALGCGIAGAFGFAYASGMSSGMSWLAGDTTLVIIGCAFISTSQAALPLLQRLTGRRLLWGILITGGMGLVYGYSVRLILCMMEPMALMRPQPFNGVYSAGLIALTLSWLFWLFCYPLKKMQIHPLMLKAYVKFLNASQPHPSTITAHRHHYPS